MASPSQHKPRKHRRDQSGGQTSASAGNGALKVDPGSKVQEPAFPLVAFLWPAKGGTSQWIILPLVLMVVGLYRWTAGLWGYSGTLFILNESSTDTWQASGRPPCMETLKLRDIGWKSPLICPYLNGTFTTWNGGVLTTLL
jgi:hypothetical protein